ncbi:YjfB family protein [Pseudomonas mangiferae]|uniref:Putative motility protein n=1 Tax=Pseudomonas mangiferae TaxID=2593654 RepID=A0A553H4Y8_9PSED|nr:YjfB family protein [Pseudomonas mangiferae]TRX76754.1 putative motility protein [Pseudomonas mangiferae]
MDISRIASAVSQASATASAAVGNASNASAGDIIAAKDAQLSSDVSVLTLKKAIDMQAQGAMALIEAIPQPASNPPHLGNTIDVRA